MNQVQCVSVERATVAARVERRFNQAGGQARLEAELRRFAFDVLGRPDQDALDASCCDAVVRTGRAVVAASVEPLVARFVAELVRGVSALPPDVRERVLRPDGRRELGFD